jgi:selenoprotein W-related protein
LKDELDLEAELQTGPSGSYEVAVDGRVVIKKQTLAFPTEQEIVDAVSKVLPR